MRMPELISNYCTLNTLKKIQTLTDRANSILICDHPLFPVLSACNCFDPNYPTTEDLVVTGFEIQWKEKTQLSVGR